MTIFVKLILFIFLTKFSNCSETNEWYAPQQEAIPASVPSNDECVQRIYRDCNYPTTFKDEELENVRQFLNYSFTVLADIKPDKPLCRKIHVRQDWKCLSQKQKRKITNVWKKLYEKGIVQKLTDFHVKYWPVWHKTHEFLPGHRWLANEFEKAMRAIDSRTTLPYWDPYLYASQPERSSVWETLGHSGNYSNGYSVTDGIYGEWGITPTVKRHWSPEGTIYPWYTQEFLTSYIQSAADYTTFATRLLGIYFNPHLNIGGYEGQYSVRSAPYDCLFYMHHTVVTDIHTLKWQLLRRELLTPLSYNDVRFDPKTGILVYSDIRTDRLTGVPDVSIKEMFWMGFGDLCSIPDQLVGPINNIWKGMRDPIPTAVRRLPQWIKEKYFPVLYSMNFTALSYTLEEVGECNTECLPIPRPTFMRETEAGRRQFQAFLYDEDYDLSSLIELMETYFYNMWLDFNRSGYCSPYVTTY